MYCPHCNVFISESDLDAGDFDGDFSYSTGESDTWSYDEDDMQADWNFDGFSSPLKRSREESTDGNDRPLKRRCLDSDIERSDAPPSLMDVDDDPIDILTAKMNSLSLRDTQPTYGNLYRK